MWVGVSGLRSLNIVLSTLLGTCSGLSTGINSHLSRSLYPMVVGPFTGIDVNVGSLSSVSPDSSSLSLESQSRPLSNSAPSHIAGRESSSLVEGAREFTSSDVVDAMSLVSPPTERRQAMCSSIAFLAFLWAS